MTDKAEQTETPPPAAAPAAAGSDRWADLRPRVVSAAVMLVLGAVAIWRGGALFAELAVLCTALMTWELARMTRGEGRDLSIPLAVLAAVVLALVLWVQAPWPLAGLLLPSVVGVLTPRRDPVVYAGYAAVIMLTGLSLVIVRQSLGVGPMIWLLAVVIASDTAGYFAGRILGGPKFWPRISPKKTWSGTIAGWVGAALVGLVAWAAGVGGPLLVLVSPLVAFAGQMGDIAESAIKRRAGVKDSSALIPGHGGLMDRFDALAFAAIATVMLQAILPFLSVIKV